MSTLEIVVALLRGAHMAALVSLFGTLVFLTLVAPAAVAEAAQDAPRLRRRLLRVARISAALALIVGIAWIAVESAVIAGAGSVAMTLQALPVVALRTQFGQWLLVRGVLLLAVLPLLRPWRAGNAVATVLAAMALAVQPMLGHAGALGGSLGTTLIISEVLHLLAAGAWLGSLLPLFITIGTLPHNAAATACRSFTPVGLSAVLMLGGTATVQVTEFMGGVPGLFGTGYGHIALVKLGLFVVLLALAAINRLALTDRLAGTAPDAARRHMRVSVATEAVLGTLVVLTAGFLASHAPGTHEQPVWPFAWRPSLSAFYEPELRNEVTFGAARGRRCGDHCGHRRGAGAKCAGRHWWWRRSHLPWRSPTSICCSSRRIRPASSPHPPSSRRPRSCTVRSCSPRTALSVMARKGAATARPPNRCRWPPADLTAEHFWAHSDGELFWYHFARLRRRRTEASRCPASQPCCQARRRWDLIDYLRAHNAGESMRDDRQMGASAADTAIRYSLCGRAHPRPRRPARACAAHRRDVGRRNAGARAAGGDRHHDGHTCQETACWIGPGDLRRERTRDLDCIRDPVRRIERGLGRRADTDRSERMAAGGVAAW